MEDAPSCQIRIVEIDVSFHLRQYMWLALSVALTVFMVMFGSRQICEAVLM